MDLVDSFLFASGLAYLWGIGLPKSATNLPLFLERLGFALAGFAILGNLFYFRSWVIWLLLGGLQVLASMASYIGYVVWKVNWMHGLPNDTAQIAMWAWDLAIAVACFLKVGVI